MNDIRSSIRLSIWDSYQYDDETCLPSENAMRAAVLLGVANSARRLPVDTSMKRMKLYMLYHNKMVRMSVHFVLFCLLLLTFVEPYWSFAATATLEFLFLIPLTIELVVRFRVFGADTWKEKGWLFVRTLSTVVIFCDIFVNIFVAAIGMTVFRVAPYMRPLFLLEKKKIRVLFESVLMSISGLINVIVLQLFILLVFSVIGVVVFKDTPEEIYFGSLGDAFVNLFVLMTTANFPTVMMPAYRENSWNALYFVGFLIFTLFIFFKLVLATVYNTYRAQLKGQVRNEWINENIALELAFKTLDFRGNGCIGFEEFVVALHSFRPSLDLERLRLLFNLLDTSGSNTLDLREFKRFSDIFNLTIARRGIEYDGSRGLLRMLVSHRFFDLIINVIVLVMVLLTLIEASGGDISVIRHGPNGISVFSLSVAIIFVIEAMLKLTAYGIKAYLKGHWNRFDLLITVSSITLELMSAIDPRTRALTLAPLVVVLRIFRLIRLLTVFKRYRVIMETFAQLVPGFVVYAGLLFVMYYLFAVLGVHLFGSPNVLTRARMKDCHCAYHERDFYANNFELVSVAFVTLFELMVVNQWMIIMDGVVYATGTGWSRLYFMSWYAISVVLVLNLLLAFVLEATVRVWSSARHRLEIEKDIEMRMDRAIRRIDGDPGRWSVTVTTTMRLLVRRMFLPEIMKEMD